MPTSSATIVGSETELIQRLGFLKQEEDATLSFTMPIVRIETHDDNISQGPPLRSIRPSVTSSVAS